MTMTMTEDQVNASERALSIGTWIITFGAVLFSVLTVTPLVRGVTPPGWGWTAPVLPIVVDTAVVVVVRLDATVGRLGEDAGAWPAILRWLTGLATLALNVGLSALHHDRVGVGVHLVAPLLLIAVSEAGRGYRAAITRALDRIAREQAEAKERSRQDQAASRAAAEREREQQRAAAERQREQERADREREREHAAQLAREEREHDARLQREREERADARAAAERDDAARQRQEEREHADRLAREQRDREDRERRAREAAARADRERRAAARATEVAAAVSTPRPTVSTPVSTAAHEAPADDKMSETEAREAVAQATRDGRSQREIAALTGWSTGWVAARVRELSEVAA